ncbi:protein CASP [Octopus bimaculoides]|uniref:protein CASP n=1 Tax=Octopus bimaculoides TaxID=37653 RepID=UPI0022E8C4C6|nr:protein CASP [Octopus bimaculoides]
MAANIQSMCQFWKDFDLTELQKNLDTTATVIANRQDESDASRKKLVDLSRDFKKNTPEDIRKVVAPLLRSFQSEIDALSKRSKFGETAFLSIYRKLIDLPDPVPILEHAISIQKKAQKVQDFEIENKQLRETLTDYNHEFAEVKNQEVTIKQLREKLKEYEERMEATVEIRKEKEIQKNFAEKERQLQETQLAVAKKLGEAEQKVSILRSNLESVQSELFDVKAKYDEATAAKSDETDMLMADLERANERAVAVERQMEQIKVQNQQQQMLISQNQDSLNLDKSEEMEQALDILKHSNLEVELSAKEKEISQLVDDVQRLQMSQTKLRESTTARINQLEEELNQKNTAYQELEEKLKLQGDYDEISRELNILKSIEFCKSSDEVSVPQSKSLELLLLEKNKSLQAETTQLKMANSELSKQYTKLQDSYKEAASTLTEQKTMISQLEEDLRSVNALSSMFRGAAEGVEAKPVTPTAEVMADFVKEMTPPVNGENDKSSLTAASSLLPIVQSQRERYRLRAQDLETQNLVLKQQVTLLQNETDKLRSDNVKLYEKIRFLQSYPSKSESHINVDETESQYSSQYEERLNPFNTFNRKERMKRYMNLKPYDKITLSMGRFIMGNKVARTVTFFYTIFLHCFVFLVLYKLAHTESCKRDMAAECQARFAEHMMKFHKHTDTEVKERHLFLDGHQ